jgi:hypothetical protein
MIALQLGKALITYKGLRAATQVKWFKKPRLAAWNGKML